MGQLVVTLICFLFVFLFIAVIANDNRKNGLKYFAWFIVIMLVFSLMVVTIGDAIANYGNSSVSCRG